MNRKHLLIMVLCCIPMIGLLVAWQLGAPLGNYGFVLALLLCPLMHLFMMRGMGHDHGKPVVKPDEPEKITEHHH